MREVGNGFPLFRFSKAVRDAVKSTQRNKYKHLINANRLI